MIVLTVRCTDCSRARGYVVSQAGVRYWAVPEHRNPGRVKEITAAMPRFPARIHDAIDLGEQWADEGGNARSEFAFLHEFTLAPCRCEEYAVVKPAVWRSWLRGAQRVVKVAPGAQR